MSMSDFETYIKKVEADYQGGLATEHTCRLALETLIEALLPGTEASNDPRLSECGAPDFVVQRHKVPLGYLETRDVGVDLDKVEQTDQMKRYFKALNNLILTDFLEFRWYVGGELCLKTRVAEVSKAAGRASLRLNNEGMEAAGQMFTGFFQTGIPTVTSTKELATRMAEQAHLIRDLIINALRSEGDSPQSALNRQYQAFCDTLLPALKLEEFADLYAQTMAYGLFAARLSAPEYAPFDRARAYLYLGANKFLRRLFLDAGEGLDGTLIAPFLDDMAALLAHADLVGIQADLLRRIRSEDPLMHFYETFLAVYDPKLRQRRGVYYTPEPVVQFIVHSVDWLLKNRFGRSWGLADPNVRILDPAAGTGTFLYYVIQSVHAEMVRRGQGGIWLEKSREVLGRVFGFELLMAPYVVSHLKLGLLMQGLGAPLGPNERPQVYLANTLEEGIPHAGTTEGLSDTIAEETSQAAHIKQQEDILVVLGNPPNSGHSANASQDAQGRSNFIGKLLREYEYVDGASLGERNLKGLQDDYVKFIRYGEYRIDRTGHGILAFVTNHGYLDTPTFRGMRQHLMQTFDEIYVLDLHGDSKKKERTPEGGPDENVFDIQHGVAILLAVKHQHTSEVSETSEVYHSKVYHASLWGLCEQKYAFLQGSDMTQVEWAELHPAASSYLFIPHDGNIKKEYERGWNLIDMMPLNSAGIVTERDPLTIHLTPKELFKTVKEFASLPVEEARSRYSLGPDVQDWKVSLAQKDLKTTGISPKKVSQILYHPFDVRFTYYTGQTHGFICVPRPEVMRHMLAEENVGFIAARQTRESWDVFITKYPCGHRACAANEINSLFPLYLYTTPEETAGTFFPQTETTRCANLAPAFVKKFAEKLRLQYIPDGRGDLKETFGPEDIFNYAYAVFQSPAYRQRYAEFLKIDFPRLPLTSDRRLFARLAAKGLELVELHLLRSPKVEEFISSYRVAGNNMVEKAQYARGKVWINGKQYFGGVPENVWDFKIGGYQVCEKWLKDRKGRVLSGEGIAYYQRMLVALKETIRILKEIDKVIPGWPVE
jgi:hypothetical protein